MNAQVPHPPADLATLLKQGGPGKFTKSRIIVLAAVLLAGLGGCLWWRAQANAASQPAPYITEALRRGDLSLTITATGNLQPTNQITVGSELSGLVTVVNVDINDRVTKGQPLAQLDTTKLNDQIASSRASLSSAQASVAQASAALKEKETILARQEELRRVSGGKVPSQAELDTAVANTGSARASLRSAQAAVAVAEAGLRINENDLTKAVIKSPVDGIVLTRSIDSGQTVAASFSAPELFVIAEKLERMKLKVTVAEADIGRVTAGLGSTFTVDAWPDRTYQATVQRVSYGSATTNNVVTYETDLTVSNDDLSLRPGMTATADIRVAERKGVFLVPTAALRFNPENTAATSAAAKKSFLQSIIPMPPRRAPENPPAAIEKLAPGTARLWLLRGARPEALLVKTGLTDGRFTEVSGDGLAENLPVVIRANPVQP
ncbi:MAG: efflux RND transporter periplasmic adaptor subunit [Verrucomicrobia bacterium]|nr:efflux RND transporter periplasmic adaptor subunit [Verrucomicrobiota bacterium]